MERQQGDFMLKMHFSAFVFVNLILVASWTMFEQRFPWFLFPLVGWGILVVLHAGKSTDQQRSRIGDSVVTLKQAVTKWR
jgi:hypothetical protein